jgi:uncharacterized protein with HEPN domain
MTDDSTQMERLRNAVESLSRPGERDLRTTLDQLLTIADAAAHLSPTFRRLNPTIPWIVLAEVGRVILRAGDAVDPRSVAVTIQRDLPELRSRLRDL